MLRICHIISGDLWAGAEVMAFHLLKRLASYPDLSLSVIVLNEGRLANELRRVGIPIQVVNEKHHSFPRILSKVCGILRGHRPHLLHSHRYKENLLAFLWSMAAPEVRLVATQHGLPETPGGVPKPAGFRSRLNLSLLCRFSQTVAVSGDIHRWLVRQIGFDPCRVRVIHNGIAPPIDVPQIRCGEGFVIGSSGRLFPVKDYPLMVRIAQEVAAFNPAARFRLAGEGPERAVLESRISALGLERDFLLEGHLDDMGEFYRRLDLYLNTSLHEGIPMSILEAMANGLPVVAPRVGGIPEIVTDGVEGFLIDGRDPADFARKCLFLHDENLRRRMSQAARERALGAFSVVQMAEEYRRLYHVLSPARFIASHRVTGKIAVRRISKGGKWSR